MPTINLTELAKIALKLLLMGVLAGIIISFVGSFITTLSDVISRMSGAGSAVAGLNLGWFAGAIGLVDFLNALMQSLFIAGGILISGVITILTFKFGMKFYTNLMRV